VKTMLALSQARNTLEVVDDQVGQPTWSRDLAQMIHSLVDSPLRSGIFHGTNAGQTSWWGFARTIFETAGLDPNRILPTTSDDFVRPAPRPAWSVLDHAGWGHHGLPSPRPWEAAFGEAWETVFARHFVELPKERQV
jgi:dTDP-4-dehydrorhamnose reductase